MGRIDLRTPDSTPLILFAGDLYVGEEEARAGTSYGLDPLLTDFIGSHDLFGVNIEAPICIKGSRQEKYSTLKMDPRTAIPLIKRIEVKIALLANNHTMDHGGECLLETISHLDQAGILYVGAGSNSDEALKPLEISLHGVKITLINLTTVFTIQSLASIDRAGVAGIRLKTEIHINPYEIFEEPGAPYVVDAQPFQEDLDRIISLVERSSESSDLTILYIHWGIGALPYSRIVLKYMRTLSSILISRGVDIVVGSHPHILLPSEKIDRSAVVYSLGNFMFSHRPKDLLFSNVGGMLSIGYSEKTGKPLITLLPICLDNKGAPRICSENYSNIPEIVEFISLSRAGGIAISPIKWKGLDLLQITL